MKFALKTNYGFLLKLPFVALYIWGAVNVAARQDSIAAIMEDDTFSISLVRSMVIHSLNTYLVIAGVLLIVILLYPVGRRTAQWQFELIGLKNKAGTVPTLLRRYTSKAFSGVTIWIFNNHSVPLDVWEDKRTAIETALDVTIVKLTYGSNKSRVILYTVPAKNDLPKRVDWHNIYLPSQEFVLALGDGYTGQVTVNLAHIPHILLGGSTGSGKSILLKCLVMQALQKGAVVSIADFKGGVDFPKAWHTKCRMCFEEATLLEELDMLTQTLMQRKELFREAGCPNLAAYNATMGKHLPRYIFACDEVAEVLDKTGLNKEQRETVDQIASRLATIARQGRAFGIHLILATQRPDATIISGQIKNNITCRICGRADNVLSMIILDNTTAADQIPSDAQGRFIMQDGTVFQGYWFDDGCI